MQASKFRRGDNVRLKGSTKSFVVDLVYYLVEGQEKNPGFYYSGESEKDIHESKLDFDTTNENHSPGISRDTQIRFSENLRALIDKAGISFTELSLGSGVSRSSCYDAAYRGAPTKVSTLVNLARFFKVTMDELMFGKIAEKKSSAGSTEQ